MRLRRFLPSDTNELAQLFLDTVRRINSRDYTPEEVAAWAPDYIDIGALGRRLLDSFSLVAEQDGLLVGFGNLESSGHVDCLYVHADFPGQGIGSGILSKLEAAAGAGGVHRVFTEASITARPFFEKRGYIVQARQRVPVRGMKLTNYRMEKFLELGVERTPEVPACD